MQPPVLTLSPTSPHLDPRARFTEAKHRVGQFATLPWGLRKEEFLTLGWRKPKQEKPSRGPQSTTAKLGWNMISWESP